MQPILVEEFDKNSISEGGLFNWTERRNDKLVYLCRRL
jgi:hypothetical protein